MTLPVTYSFPEPAGVLADPPWTQLNTTVLESNGSGGTDVDGGSTGECMAIWNLDTFPDDQQVQATLFNSLPGDGSHYVGMLLRDDGATWPGTTCYRFFSDGGSQTDISAFVAGVESVLASDPTRTFTAGDVLTFSVTGTALDLALNGVSIMTVTDATIASGQPGLYEYSSLGHGGAGWESFVGSGSGGGGGSSVHVLSGRGNIPITSPAWLSTALTGTIPVISSTGMAEPPNYFHVGMLSWGTYGSGAMRAYPITRLLDLVELPAGMDTLWYEIAPGLVATVTELATP